MKFFVTILSITTKHNYDFDSVHKIFPNCHLFSPISTFFLNVLSWDPSVGCLCLALYSPQPSIPSGGKKFTNGLF